MLLLPSYHQGKDLPAKDLSGTSDPYVRVTLLPDKKHRLETKIKRRTLNPRWNETFYFEGFPIQKLNSRVLHLHVFDYDRFSRDDSIGEVFLPLCQVCLPFYLFIYIEWHTIYLAIALFKNRKYTSSVEVFVREKMK